MFTCKMIVVSAEEARDGGGVVKEHVPQIVTRKSNKDYNNRSGIGHLQLADRTNYDSLDLFKDGYLGQIHKIWARIPVSLLEKGKKNGWRKITKQCKNIILTRKTNSTLINKVYS